MEKFDWIIKNGRVIDPSQALDKVTNIGLAKGKIAAIGDIEGGSEADQIYDATGHIVTPGLVDLHIHGYEHVTPLGIDVDHYCLGRGVTTAIDAGSAGCDTFDGFRHFAAERSQTRLLAFLHISRAGLAFSSRTGGDDPGELETLKLVHTRDCIDCIESNRDLLVGVKIRLSSSIANDGRNEVEAYKRAREAAGAVELPLMTHHNFSFIPLEDCPGAMERGDIYTHCFHAYPNTIIDPVSNTLFDSIVAARDAGVLFDIGHGMGSFSWPVAELCAQQGFWPDTISTDIHSLNRDGPVYDLPTVMSRMLKVGMPLVEIIRASTINPAKAIGWDDRIGTLDIGRDADISVLALDSVTLQLEDCHAQLRSLESQLIPKAVWRAGNRGQITSPKKLPDCDTYQTAIDWQSKLIIRD